MYMSVIKVGKSNFKEVTNSREPVLLDFYADWCGPCQMISPIVHEIADEFPQYTVGKVNVDEEMELAQRFSVVSIPMLVVLRDGKIAAQAVGLRSKEDILSMLEA